MHATLSLEGDFEDGQKIPTAATVTLVLEGIQELKYQLQHPHGICESNTLAVACLWWYEVVLSSSCARYGLDAVRRHSRVSQPEENIRAHVSGLRKMIRCIGGLDNLCPETRWLLAWYDKLTMVLFGYG